MFTSSSISVIWSAKGIKVRSRAVTNRLFSLRKYLFSFIWAQHVLNYHLIWVPWTRMLRSKLLFPTKLSVYAWSFNIQTFQRDYHRVWVWCLDPCSIPSLCTTSRIPSARTQICKRCNPKKRKFYMKKIYISYS